jgi:hypothetical protein
MPSISEHQRGPLLRCLLTFPTRNCLLSDGISLVCSSPLKPHALNMCALHGNRHVTIYGVWIGNRSYWAV